ncbi:hypothetical protein Tco_0036263 [Tanacetum coccineum]
MLQLLSCFFTITGVESQLWGHPPRMFRRCSAIDLETPFISSYLQANMSRLFLSKSQSFILPFSDRFPLCVTTPSCIENLSISCAVDGTA